MATSTPILPAPPTVTSQPTASLIQPASLALSLAQRTVASGDILTISARTAPRATVSATLIVTQTKLVLSGTGQQRKTVRQTVTLYKATLGGTADAQGRYTGRLRLTYKVTKATAAQFTLTARLGTQVLKRTALLTIMPALSLRLTAPKSVMSGGYLMLTVRTSAAARLSVTLEVVTTKSLVKGKKTVRQEVVLYRATLNGTTDKAGQFTGRLGVTHKPTKAVQARLSVVARTSYTAATRSVGVTIQPRR
jgi:hypothetical protein